ncbi:titin-like [Cydia splendana]|uniref:titin-like n=1 Tax=Cydia splendana TaxID=1100963 RepID=UPI00300C5C81
MKHRVVEEAPEKVEITQIRTESGDVKKVKTTKRVIKKGPKEPVTEITTIEKEGEEPITTVTVAPVPEEDDQITPEETIELPEEVAEQSETTPEGKTVTKKTTKRIIKRKKGPLTETTQITTEQVDDETPVISVHTTQEITDDTTTPLDTKHTPEKATVVEEAPEKVEITQVRTETGDVKKVKTTKRVIKKGPKEPVTEITTIEKEGEEPITTVTVAPVPEEDDQITPEETIELPEEVAEQSETTPEGKTVTKKTTKRIIKRKKGPLTETTQITTEQVDDETPVISVHTTQEITDDTTTPLDTKHTPEKATVVEEAPEKVEITQVRTETGDVKKVKTTKRIIKKGPKEPVTEITTIEKEGDEPITTVTVALVPEEDETTPIETVELPEEIAEETETTPEGKTVTKKTTKRIIKRKKGPLTETTQITTEQVDDETPIISVHTTQELHDDITTPILDTHTLESARVVEESPEKVEVTQVRTDTGEVKKVKTTKRLIKKGPKEPVTEITTIEKEGEEPITTVTVSPAPEEDQTTTIETVELPEEIAEETDTTPEGKTVTKKTTKRTIKRKKGPLTETTQITTEQVDDETPIISVHTTQELHDDTTKPLLDTHTPEIARVVEETPEKVEVTQVRTDTGEVKKVKTTKRVIKRGPKEPVTEITTIEKEGEEPITTVTVSPAPEEDQTTPIETIELPEEIAEETDTTPEGKTVTKKTTKRTIKRKKGPLTETTQITTEQVDDETPIISVHTTQELHDDTTKPLLDTYTLETARVVEETPEKVEVTKVRTDTGEVKKVKTTKRVIKKGPKEPVTEITTIEKEGEEPITTVTVSPAPEEDQTTPIETVELPEEIAEETDTTPKGKTVTKGIIKRKKGPLTETTQITTEQVDDETPIISVHTTQELHDDTTKPLLDTHTLESARVVQETPEKVEVTQVRTDTGEVKKVKTTKRVIKKGPKEPVTEITTIEKEGEEPITTVTVSPAPEEDRTAPIETVEIPEEIAEETETTPEGKTVTKKTTKRIIKRKKGPLTETTQITTEQVDDETPIISVHTTQELHDDTTKPLLDTHTLESARVVEETPEKIEVTQVRTDTGEVKQVKTTKRIIKKGPKEPVTEITTIEKEGEEPITTVTVSPAPEEDQTTPIETVELPEEIAEETDTTPEGKIVTKKTTKRIIKRKKGPLTETTQITTEQVDGETPIISVHTTQELHDDTTTPILDTHTLESARVVQETPEKVEVTQVRTDTGEVKKVKTTKRVIKTGPKEPVTEITTIEKEGEEPITTVTVSPAPEEDRTAPIETVEMPEEIAEETETTPEGKTVTKKTTKRIIKRKKGPLTDTTQITTEQVDDSTPIISVHTTQEYTDDTTKPLFDTHILETARVVEEAPENVEVTQVRTDTGEVKKVKTTKRVIKKGPKEPVTEITTIEKEGEEPITTVTVSPAPEGDQTTPIETVELPEEIAEETETTPEGKTVTKKTTKRIIKRKKGPLTETTQITTEQVDDETPIISVHTTQELHDDITTPILDTHTLESARVVEESPEKVEVTQVRTNTGEVKKVKTTKRVIKKGPKEPVTEITTIEKEGEEPITTVTVSPAPEEDQTTPIETIELPEEIAEETDTTPEGKTVTKKTTKRTIKRKKGPLTETTQITTEQVDDETPIISVHTTQELHDDTTKPLLDTHTLEIARVVEETPEKVEVTQVRTDTGDVKKVKTTKRVIKKGPKEPVTEITTIEKEGEEPITTVMVSPAPEDDQTTPIETVELPEEIAEETETTPEGKTVTKKTTKRIIKRKKGPLTDTTQITTEQVDDSTPIISVHTTQEYTDDTTKPLFDTHILETARVVEEAPEKVEVTQVRTDTGEVKKVKTTKRVIKKGPKEPVTEITTIEKEGEEPITTVSVSPAPEDDQTTPIETVELPEEIAEETETTPEGKTVTKKTTKRIIKRKKGPLTDTTQITTEQVDDSTPIISVHTTQEYTEQVNDSTPIISVHTTQEYTDDTTKPLFDTHILETARVVEEAPENVEVTQVRTDTGEVKKVKTTKRVIKKGPKEPVTEITTIEKEGEEPITTVTVSPAPEDDQTTPIETVELPEEIAEETETTPEGKTVTKKTTKRIIKRKKGPLTDTTQITTEQVDDSTPIISVHTTPEYTDDTTKPLFDTHILETARVVEEAPEKVEVTQVRTDTGEVKKVKTTKRVIKKGPKEPVTEITTIEKEGEEPITTVTVSPAPEDDQTTPIETVELPEEIAEETETTPEGKTVTTKTTKRIIKRKKGPLTDTTQITTEQVDDSTPIISVHTTQEYTDDTTKPLFDTHILETARVVEEAPEKVEVTQVRTDTGEVKKVKTTKRVIKKGPKEPVTEITTIEKEGEEPITTVTVSPAPEDNQTTPIETVELPEEIAEETETAPEGKTVTKKTTKRIIKRKKGPLTDTTQITTEQVDDSTPIITVHTTQEYTEQVNDSTPIISVHTTQEYTDDTTTPLIDTHTLKTARVVEETPEKVEATPVRTDTGGVKKVKTTKGVIKKGSKEPVTEITTIEKEGEEPITTVTVASAPEEQQPTPAEIFELPEKISEETETTPAGKTVTKKTTHKIIKCKKGPLPDTTQIITEQVDDNTPIISVHSTQEYTDDKTTPLVDTHTIETARVVDEVLEKIEINEVRPETSEVKKRKPARRVIKKGTKEPLAEITATEKESEEPITAFNVSQELEEEQPTHTKTTKLPETISEEIETILEV